MAPARCATAVSTAITRSSSPIAAAVSAKSIRSSSRRKIGRFRERRADSASRYSRWRLTNVMPAIERSGSRPRQRDTAIVIVLVARLAGPDQANAWFAKVCQARPPRSNAFGRRTQIGHRSRDGRCVVPNDSGRLISGQCTSKGGQRIAATMHADKAVGVIGNQRHETVTAIQERPCRLCAPPCAGNG